jgi:uncharacterized protein
MKLSIKVLPRSSKNEIVEMPDKSLKIKLTAAPVDGEANKKLIALLAEHFDVAKSKIKIVSGLTSKNKIVEID